MSVLAAVTARMMELGLEMYLKINSLIWISMSLGWSPTGTCLYTRSTSNHEIHLQDHFEFIDHTGSDTGKQKGNLSHLGDARKVHQCEVHNVWREDFQVNGFITNTLGEKKLLLLLQNGIA